MQSSVADTDIYSFYHDCLNEDGERVLEREVFYGTDCNAL